MARPLRSAGPLSTLDRAIGLARHSALEVAVPAWAGGSVLAAALLGIYYVERVEGISSLRLPLALLLVLAFGARSVLLARAAGRVALALWDPGRSGEATGRTVDVLRTAWVAGLGLWVWSWLLVLGSLGGPVGVVAVVPLLALRGAVAPSWLARATREPDAGWRAFGRAIGDTGGRRFEALLIEAMMLAGALGLALNLYVLLMIGLLLARSFAGIELASIETFLSPNNTFVLLTVGASALILLEPLRAALSALAYTDARVREDGLDLRAAVEDAIERSARRAPPPGARAAAALLVVLAGSGLARAQEPPPAFPPPPLGEALDEELTEPGERPLGLSLVGHIPYARPTDGDLGADERAREILSRSEFRELAEHRGDGLRELVERLFEWLLRPREELPQVDTSALSGLALPGAWFFIAAALVLLLAVGVFLFVTRRRERRDAASAASALTSDPRDRPPAAFLDDAARLAESGELRDALRALYLATLVALDRRRLIAFDPHLTNWKYLRQMPRGSARDAFAAFTRLFDHKWYGREPTTPAEYERCRVLAQQIVGDVPTEAAA